MASLLAGLPPPKNASHSKLPSASTSTPVNSSTTAAPSIPTSAPSTTVHSKTITIPPYGKRKSWIPKSLEDFGDGGSYPEIHVAQFPLGMGKKGLGASSSNVNNDLSVLHTAASNTQLALYSDNEGRIAYDSIVTQAHAKDKVVYSKYTDLIPSSEMDTETLKKPSEEEEQANTEKTRDALEKIINFKISASYKAGPKHQSSENEKRSEDVYFRYTPATSAQNGQSNEDTRIVKVEEAPVDPLDPPKFKHKKAPRGPPSPPVPIMRSPPKKLTKEDAQNWTIPSAISNWKNPKGNTIPLEKRLVNDGQYLQETVINNRFATMAESLYLAEMNAREQIEKKAQYEMLKQEKIRQAKDEAMHNLAKAARSARFGGTNKETVKQEEPDERRSEYTSKPRREQDSRSRRRSSSSTSSSSSSSSSESESSDDEEGYKRRERIREEKKRELEKQKRKSKKSTSENVFEDDRDISEKVALGQMPTQSTDAQIDSRLFEFNTGLDSGFGTEDSYNIYDKPLFKGSSANQLYHHRKGAIENYSGGDEDLEALTNKSSEFQGSKFVTETKSLGGGQGLRTSGPVQFEREQPAYSSDKAPQQQEDDPFGMNQFMSSVKKNKPLDHIGKSGMMHAVGGSSTSDTSQYKDTKRSRIDFEKSSSSSQQDSNKRNKK